MPGCDGDSTVNVNHPMSKSDLRSQLHDPDYWLGPYEPPTLIERIGEALGTALLVVIFGPLIIVSFALLGYILLGTSVPGWVLLFWFFFLWGRPGTASGSDEDR